MAIRAIDPQTYEVIHLRTDREPYCEFATGARIVPAFRDGVSIGLKLFSIRPGSTYARAGLRNGDVVLNINGMPLSSPEQALTAYKDVMRVSRIQADIERDGKRLMLTYIFQEPQPKKVQK